MDINIKSLEELTQFLTNKVIISDGNDGSVYHFDSLWDVKGQVCLTIVPEQEDW